jgi:hypothetical protein
MSICEVTGLSHCSRYGNRIRHKRKIDISEASEEDAIRAGIDLNGVPFYGIVGKHCGIVIGYAIAYWDYTPDSNKPEVWLISSVPLFAKYEWITLAKFSKLFVDILVESMGTIKVAQDKTEPTSERFLKFLGFVPAEYEIDNHKVWIRYGV